MEIKEIRRRNLIALLEQMKLSHPQFVQIAGGAAAHISQIITRHRAMGSMVARRIEEKFRLPHGWMDAAHQPAHKVQELPRAYDLADAAELDLAMEKFRALDPAFREYIMLTMDNLARLTSSLPEFLRGKLKPPDRESYYEWQKNIEGAIAKLKMRNGEKSIQ